MSVKLLEEALKDKKDISEEQWTEVKSKIKEATEELNHKDLKLVPNPLLKHGVWQLTVDEEKTDHRVYIDVKGSHIVVLAIWNFEFTHKGDEHWRELSERIE